MEGKKKYFALIIFLFLGLMIFTFANPAEEEKEFKGGDKDQSETVTNKREDTTEEDTNDIEQEQQDQNQQQNIVTNNNQGNAQGNQGNDAGQTEEDPVDTTLRDALAAVEKAEGTYTQDDVDAAKDLVNNVTDTTEKGKLEERLEEVEAGIAVLALLEQLETKVDDAEEKAHMTAATTFRDTNEIANKIATLNNETVKTELEKRLTEVSKLLDDNAAPTTKVEDKVYGEDVVITAEDEAGNKFQIFLTKKGESETEISNGYKTTSDGTYTLRLVDEAFNEQTITFTVDTTAPELKDLTNGAHYEEITLNVEDDTKVTIKVTNNDTSETKEMENGTKLTEDATYTVELTDEAGNTSTYELVVDTTAPTIDVEDNNYATKDTDVLIQDKFLTTVTVKHVAVDGTETTEEFLRADFSISQNYQYTYKLDKDGTYTITAEDKIGNSTTKTVIMDQTPAKANAVNINVIGYKNDVNEQYATNNKKVSAYISISEELKNNPTFTFYANGKKIKEFTSEVVKSTSKNEKYPYVYTATLDINEELVAEDGLLTFTVTNIYDKAGNPTADISKVTTKKVITLDRTTTGLASTNIYVNSKGNLKEFYATNGNTVAVTFRVKEELSKYPTFTFYANGKEVDAANVKLLDVRETDGIYTYEANLKISEALVAEDGEITFKITDIVDKAGNKGFINLKGVHQDEQTAPTNGNKVYLDRTKAARVYSTIRSKGVEFVLENGKDKDYYHKNGTTFEYAISFNELLAEVPTVTISGRNLEMKLNETVLKKENKYLYEGTFKIAEDEKDLTEGILEIKVTNVKDRAGNETVLGTQTKTSNGRRVIYDRTAATRMSTDFYVSKLTAKEKVFYTQLSNTIVVNVTTNERLGQIPTFTLHNNGKNYVIEGAIYRGLNDKGYHLYQASYELKEKSEMKDGEITFTISDIVDIAGNKTNNVVEATNGRKVILDTVLKVDKLAVIGKNRHKVENVYYQYASNDTIVYINARFKEELAATPIVKLNNKVTLTKATKKESEGIWIYSYSYKLNKDDGLEDGVLQVKVTNIKDNAGNTTELTNKHMTMASQSNIIVDKTLPEIKNIPAEGAYVNYSISPKISEPNLLKVVLTKDGNEVKGYQDNMYELSHTGTYTLTVTDRADHKVTRTFTIDQDIPSVEGVENNKHYNVDVTPTVTDKYLEKVTLNGKEFVSGTTLTEEGVYTLIAKDKAGNEKNVTFTIDKTDPVINGFEAGKYYYNTSVKPEVVETNLKSITLNGKEYDGKAITKDGVYTLVATDEAGNDAEVKFEIDKIAPLVTGVELFNKEAVKPVIEDKNFDYVTVDGLPFVHGKSVKLYGKHQLVAYDKAGNSTTVDFTIDTIAPKILLLDRLQYISGKYLPIKPVILEQYVDTIVVKKNGEVIPYEKGQELPGDAEYEMTVTDKAGNSTTVKFTMDSVSPTALVKPVQMGVVDELDLNNMEIVDGFEDLNLSLLEKDLLLSEEVEYILLKNTSTISVLGVNIPIYKYDEIPQDEVIDEEGDYLLVVYDKAYNISAVRFTVDRSAPIINAKDGEFYKSLTLNVEDPNLSSITVKKKGVAAGTIVENGYVIDKNGTYTITAKDIIGENALEENYKNHITTVTIHIDTKAPTANVVEGGIYKKVTVNVKDEHLNKVTINGKEYDGKEINEKGTYKLLASDKANNKLEVNFEIDPTPITITGVTDKELYNTDKKVTVTARDTNAKVLLNGTETTKEFTVTKEGKNTIKVTDKWGNEESATFTLDKTAATINNPFDALKIEVGAAKDSSKKVEALVTDNLDADRYLKPTVKHSVKGEMGELSSIPTTADYVGEYTLTYNTKDAAGNTSKTLEVKVNVVIKDYVVKFVDVDKNNFTYTYGDTISPYKVTIYSAALGKNVDYEEKDVSFSVEGNKTLTNAGTYKVTATVNTKKFPGATEESQVFTITQKEVEVTFSKTNGTTTLYKYEYDGNTKPFTATITSGLINDDTATVEVTYDTTTFDAGTTHTATANIIDNKNYKVKNADYQFEVTKATATIVINSKDDVQITNNEGQKIEGSVKINTTTGTATGTAKGGIAYGKYEIEKEKKYNVDFTIVDVVSTNTKNVVIEPVPTKGVESLDNITQSLNNIKSSIESSSIYKIIKRLAPELSITLEEDVTDNLNIEVAKVTTEGTSKLFVDTPKEI